VQVFSKDDNVWFTAEVVKEAGEGKKKDLYVLYEHSAAPEVVSLSRSMIVKEDAVVWVKSAGFPWWPGQIWRDVTTPASCSFVEFLGDEDKMEWLRDVKTGPFQAGLEEHLETLMSTCQGEDDNKAAESAVEIAFSLVSAQNIKAASPKRRSGGGLKGASKRSKVESTKSSPTSKTQPSSGKASPKPEATSPKDLRYDLEVIPEQVFQSPMFPVPDDRELDVPLDDGGVHECGWKMINKVYQYIAKQSRLDWGLTSDVGAFRQQRTCRTDNISALQDTWCGSRIIDDYWSTPPERLEMTKSIIDEYETDDSHTGTRGSEGYGEATVSSMAKMFHILRNMRHLVLDKIKPLGHGDLDPLWDCNSHSTFLDIGSGYGKVNFHAKVMCDVRLSVGIECVFSRYRISETILDNLKEDTTIMLPEYSKHIEKEQAEAKEQAESREKNMPKEKKEPELAITKEVSEPGSTKSRSKKELTAEERDKRRHDAEEKFRDEMTQLASVHEKFTAEGVVFKHSDATMEPHLGYDHIYVFDRVFSRLTMKALAKLLQASDFRVLVSSRHWREWWSFGLTKVQPVAKVRISTTGKEKCTAYVYINVNLFPTLPVVKGD